MRGKRESNLLVHANCIYYVNDSQRYGQNHPPSGLSPEFLQNLVSGRALPDVCLPLEKGQIWGNPKQVRDFWTVTGLGSKPESWRIDAHLASGDDNTMWFERGVGLTAARVYHNGTYDGYRLRLLKFQHGRTAIK